eukprot:5410409-Amphidinium_carterae.1
MAGSSQPVRAVMGLFYKAQDELNKEFWEDQVLQLCLMKESANPDTCKDLPCPKVLTVVEELSTKQILGRKSRRRCP